MIERIRAKAFGTLLRQEVAYFDQPENSSAAISNHLSSDARALQQMTGPRLGIICEASVMAGIGLILAFVFNYLLATILVIFFAIIIIINYWDVRLNAKVTQRSGIILRQASTVRLNLSNE